MELPFEKTVCRHWRQKLYTLVNQEETQELKLPESMPDVGRIIASWGQTVLRGKDWRTSGAGISGGVLIWLLYAPEGGGPLQRLESWIPFQTRVDFADSGEDGTLRVECVLRNVDARNVSGRKIMLRAGIGLLVQALEPAQTEIPVPQELPEDVEQLTRSYPVNLIRESEEKSFLMDEDLELPAGIPEPEKLIYYRLDPEILEEKVMGSKAVFRGVGKLHMLYQDSEQRLCCHDAEIPFAQYVDLEGEYGNDASVSTLCAVTSLELEMPLEGGLRLKCGITAQYVIEDVMMVEMLEDAYSPCREVQLERQEVTLPAWVDRRQELFSLSQSFPAEDSLVVDQVFNPDLPVITRQPGGATMEYGGTFQTVVQMSDGSYAGKTFHDTQSAEWKTECATIPFSIPRGTATCRKEGPNWRTDTQVVADLRSLCETPMELVSAMEIGETGTPDPERPSVIIRRMGDRESLWELAKDCGSTVSAIRRLNQLEGEPAEEQLLLIPVV